MKKIVLGSLLLCNLFADDMDMDMDMDSMFVNEFQETTKEEQKSNFTFDGNLKLRHYYFIYRTNDKAPKNNDQSYLDALLEIGGKYIKDDYIFASRVYFMDGTEHYSYRGEVFKEFRDKEKGSPMAGLKEFYGIKSSDNLDYTIGKKIFSNSKSILYSPSDIYNTTIAPDPLDPYKIGIWLGKIDYYKDNQTFSAAIFPSISQNKVPDEKSRWSGTDKVEVAGNFRGVSPNDVRRDTENKIRGLLRYQNTISGWDILLTTGFGPSLYSVLLKPEKDGDPYVETYPNAIYVSGGFSTTYDKLEIHGEAYYQNVEKNEDDEFVSAVIGSRYTLDKWVDKVGFNKLDMIIEYVKEFTTVEMDNPKVEKSSKDQRAPKNDILIKVDAEINAKWSFNYFANFRLEIEEQKDSGRYQHLGFTYKMKDGLTLMMAGELFNGDENSYYGKWRENDRFITQINYSF